KDAIVIGAQIVTALQQITSRRIDPLETAVVAVGQFQAGDAFNIIADQARLTGTVRYLKTAIQEQVLTEMEKIVDGICNANESTYDLNCVKGYPPLANQAQEATLILEASQNIKDIHSREEIRPVMGGEDFAYYIKQKPGAYFFTGAQKEDNPHPHHHPKLDIAERA